MAGDEPLARPESDRRREGLAVAAVLLIAAGLRLWRLDRNGFGNSYYGAAVRSMLASTGNFFFGSFDPAGVVTVDKPPVALWIQALSAKILGYSGVAVLLPQALMGVASVALTYHLVRRIFGVSAGFLAGLALAVTPICVAVDRDNLPDSALVLVLLLATWALTRSVETGKPGLLMLSTALVGLAFNVKMLAAFVVLPTFYLAYFLGSSATWRAQIGHLVAATGVLVVASFSWPIAVELTPKASRPYIGGSMNNSALELAVGYNGIARIMGMGGPMGGGPPGGPMGGPPGMPRFPGASTGGDPARPDDPGLAKDQEEAFGPPPFGPGGGPPPFGPPPFGPGGRRGPGGPGGMSGFGGTPGLLRFAQQEMSGLITWLFPIAVLGSIVAAAGVGRSLPIGREALALVLWGGWFGTHWVVFSFARGIFHDYYTTVMGPAVAALFGIGAMALWKASLKGGWRVVLLPSAIVLTAAWQSKIVWAYPEWSRWLVPVFGVGAVLSVVGLIGSKWLSARWESVPWASLAAGVGLASMMVGPSAWASTAMLFPGSSLLPTAGPSLASGKGQGPPMMPFESDPESARKLIAFLRANRHEESILVASMASMPVAPIIIETGEAAVSLGGFMGADPAMTKDRFIGLVEGGKLRFFLNGPGPGGGGGPGGGFGGPGGTPGPAGMPSPPPGLMGPPGGFRGNSEIATWVREHGESVPQELWMKVETEEDGEADFAEGPDPMMPFPRRMRRMTQLYDLRPDLGLVVPESP
ncbi:glycosyltransferase family 39 protein [Tundrisphaera lichenicola]|uniref:glycosyltransferase family 39 protein n=1 Tax=Tundrisphaera lichenicola TaxID=2029860 RepID=UPI003EBC633B